MAIITTILGVGFLFAILFLVKTNSLPDYLQVAVKGLKVLTIITIIGGFCTWVYYQLKNDTASKDFIGSWQYDQDPSLRRSYEFLSDSTFYLREEYSMSYGKWDYDAEKEILTVYILQKVDSQGLKKMNPPEIEEFNEVIEVEKNKIRLLYQHEFIKSKIPFNLKKQFFDWVKYYEKK